MAELVDRILLKSKTIKIKLDPKLVFIVLEFLLKLNIWQIWETKILYSFAISLLCVCIILLIILYISQSINYYYGIRSY